MRKGRRTRSVQQGLNVDNEEGARWQLSRRQPRGEPERRPASRRATPKERQEMGARCI